MQRMPWLCQLSEAKTKKFYSINETHIIITVLSFKNSVNYQLFYMKKMLPFKSRSILQSVLFVLISLYSFAAIGQPQLSVVTDKSPGVSVNNGLSKLMDALKSKNIQFEKVNSVDEAKGKVVIVAGLSTGNGVAAIVANC